MNKHLPTSRAADLKQAAAPSLAIILLSRGGAYTAGLTELSDLAARLEAAMRASGQLVQQVTTAYVDRAQPTLGEALDLCAEARSILILPVMVPDEASLRRWLHKLIMRWRAARDSSQPSPRLVFGQPLLQLPGLTELLARSVEDALRQPDVPEALGDDPWERDPRGWSLVPEHRQHVLWCVGPRCAAKGALQLWPVLTRTIRDTPGLKNHLQPLQTGCQYPCNHGPLMIVYPDGVWYGPMDADSMATTLTGHVLHGRVDADRRVHGPEALRRP
ncbi:MULTISPECIES: (2Fe-2S) ferredoxin domain-containing protein [Comamonas]|uniref:(2Fe-2S) ferredoxin domain-containing protein n=1 Tax=Comamonas TaxID=283 RepID=UPI0012C11B5D|nr:MULTISPECIES: (2Fe-2S) ferredoxin domain-containing protein [Comamonas]MEB5964939.1 cobalamin biosynthesis protein CbiX [Comamonas testosteroni]MPS93949.1 cobalamin biosynthesis protein CbiX [Comamonas sp.]